MRRGKVMEFSSAMFLLGALAFFGFCFWLGLKAFKLMRWSEGDPRVQPAPTGWKRKVAGPSVASALLIIATIAIPQMWFVTVPVLIILVVFIVTKIRGFIRTGRGHY